MEYLAHHGILGQKWGIRRFQNKDGSYTAAGKKKYFNEDGTRTDAGKKIKAKRFQSEINQLQKNATDLQLFYWNLSDSKKIVDEKIRQLSDNNKTTPEKLDNWKKQGEIITNKMITVSRDYDTNIAFLDHYTKMLKQDPDLVYRVKRHTTAADGKAIREYDKILNKEHGISIPNNDPAERAVIGDKYEIVANTDRNRKKKKFVDPNYKKEIGYGNRVRTTTYFV